MELQPLTPAERAERSALSTLTDSGPPAAVDAEAAILGALLFSPEDLPEIARRLRPADFYDRQHRDVFATMLALSEAAKPVSVESVRLESEASAYFLADLATRAGTDPAYLANVVREKAMLREIGALTARLSGEARNQAGDPFDLLDAMREGHDEIVGSLPSRAFTTMAAALDAADSRVDVPGAPCRLTGLRAILGGWKPGKLYVAAGRPGMGKSSHAKSEARHIARTPETDGGGTVAVFTLEMGADEYADRIRDEEEGLAATGDHAYRNPRDLPIFLDDSARLTTTDIRAKLHRLRNEALSAGAPPLALVVVDYLQLLQGRGDNREQEVASIARDLKIIAREFDVAVLALAQLSRACEQRSDKHPMLSDLRESGEIEQAADVVLFYYRAEMYGAEQVEVGEERMLYDAKGTAEVVVGKHRGGSTGTVWSRFHGPTTSFRDFDEPRPGLPVRLSTPTPF